jgi:hypothetical protein
LPGWPELAGRPEKKTSKNAKKELCINCRNSLHPEPCTVTVTPVVDPITRDNEATIAEMDHYHDQFTESKKKLKTLKKFVKLKIKAELKLKQSPNNNLTV